MKNYTDILREHNLKVTPQRLAISEALYNSGHMSIEELYSIMVEKFHSISLATIYKNINIMIESSFIQEVKIPHEKSVYELTKESHAHLYCNSCKTIEDITIDLNQIITFSTQTTHFKINKTSLILSGLCKNCQ